MTRSSINVEHMARVEGHGDICVVITDGVVETVQMRVVEPARLFESMVRGRSFNEVSYIASRVCGICSATHVVTDLKAIESVFGVEVSQRTKDLRELMVHGSYIQNHATHLYVFAAPDFLGEESVFPLAETNRELFDKALGLKGLGNELSAKIGGRPVHPITAVIGGFTSEISRDEYLELADKLEAAIPFALQTVDFFSALRVQPLSTEGDMLAMIDADSYPIERSDTGCFVRSGETFQAIDYDKHLEEYIVDHSAAKFARVRSTGRSYMTCALARINASWDKLCPQAKVAAAKAGLRPPAYNPMLNNVAQAVEIVDALERCAASCRRLAETVNEETSKPVDFKIKAGRGVGFTEAPRGSAFHEIELDEEGRVVHASILTPTAQNVANLEGDMLQLANLLVAEGAPEDLIRLEIEKLVRAYDPCLSCSVH